MKWQMVTEKARIKDEDLPITLFRLYSLQYEINDDGSPNTAHSLNPVPFFIIDNVWKGEVKPGKLADIAPTILSFMGIPLPKEMTGNILASNL